MTDDVAKLRHHRELGACLLNDLIQATPETAVGLIERVNAWERDLIPLVELFGVGAAARFKPLITLLPHEQLSVARSAPLDEETTNGLVANREELRGPFEAGDTIAMLKVSARILAGPLMDKAIDNVREDLRPGCIILGETKEDGKILPVIFPIK